MMNKVYKKLRERLPRNYLTEIVQVNPRLTKRQVRAVFNGEIINHNVVDEVVTAALKVERITIQRHKKMKQKLSARRRFNKSLTKAA